jgi:hypothetical protein
MKTIATYLSYERGADQRNCLFTVRQFSTDDEGENHQDDNLRIADKIIVNP